jgi:hypothetical protein
VPDISDESSADSTGDDAAVAGPAEADDKPTPRSRWSRRRKATVGCLGLLVLLIAFGSWLAFSAHNAKSSLEEARSSAALAKDALLKGDTAGAAGAAADARKHAQSASDATHSLPWSVAALVPWLGSPFEAGQQVTEVVLGLAADVLEPSAAVGKVISPDQLVAGGRIDVQMLRSEEPKLKQISDNATRLNTAARAIVDPGFMAELRDARGQLQAQTAEITSLLNNTALAARLAPALMGADEPRTYFLGFQTNAEARGTGGLLGGFGILRFDDGAASVDTLAPNTQLDKQFTPIDLGPEYTDLYGFSDPTTDYRNSNFSPHFPYAAQVWKSLWAQQTGQQVDGAMAIDPVALSYILGAVGPVTMADGEVVTQDNVVELTESTAYVRFPTDQAARKRYLQDIAQEVVKKITGPVASPRALLDALGKGVSEGRIALWSAVPEDQALLEQTPLAHVVPDDAAPYASIVINNLGGNKLDYYLRRQISYSADACTAGTRNSTVLVNLASTAPPGLPDYVAASPGLVTSAPINVPPGTMITSIRLIGTKGATLKSAFANNQRVPVFQGVERGHPTFEVQVAIPAGKSGDLVFNLSEPSAPGVARVPVQPLADTPSITVSVPPCSG